MIPTWAAVNICAIEEALPQSDRAPGTEAAALVITILAGGRHHDSGGRESAAAEGRTAHGQDQDESQEKMPELPLWAIRP